MREILSLNSGWRYIAEFEDEYVAAGADLSGWERVCLPHANREMPLNGFDERAYQFVSCYARDLDLPSLAGGRRAFLDFEGVMCACELWIDGRRAGSHIGGYTPFSLEITDLVQGPGPHRLAVKVDSTERVDVPPFGHVVDYLCFGGIYREVALRVQERALLADCFVRPLDALAARKRVEADAELDARLPKQGEGAHYGSGAFSLEARLLDGGRLVAESAAAPSLVDGRASAQLELSGLEDLEIWDIEHPALYELELVLREGGEAVDRLTRRIGFRQAEFRKEGFFLNGRLLGLRGLNRHQAWPYVGYAMPARAQRRDAEILKRELGVNIVRTSHYPQSRHFLDACDELGLLVFEELPGWQHIGDAAWKDAACSALEEMIRRDRSRPSICLWGVRINESRDDHDFYARTNALARALDPTRQTGGVRYLEKSELLEDVYTFNDFVHSGGKTALKRPRRVAGRRRVPYLVTEHNGHMFPTKRFDGEERLMEHALRHLRVLEAASATPGIAGAIGWCAFDYNTHKDFGSGDRVCYHGVMDMFRVPKYAAAVYASQRPPASGIVLEAASIFAKGERSAARLLPVQVYTNCDEIELYRNGIRIGRYLPAHGEYPCLEHPPVVIRDLIGDQLEGTRFSRRDQAAVRRLAGKVLAEDLGALSWLELLRLGAIFLKYRMSMVDAEALIGRYALGWGQAEDHFEIAGLVGGKEVARRRYGGDAYAATLAIEAEDSRLSAGDWDTTRVLLRLEDQYGNLCPFAAEAIEVSVSGPASAIGPTRLPLIGGCAAFWLRTTGEPGRIEVRARGSRFDSETLGIEVRVDSTL
jgi:beta-galactosidase